MKVLVVDDDDAIRMLIHRVLKRKGIEASLARDGEEALEMISQDDYEFVFLDMIMPKIDGYTVLKRLEGEYPDYLHRVYAITATPGLVKEMVPYIRGIISKPFDVKTIEDCLKNVN